MLVQMMGSQHAMLPDVQDPGLDLKLIVFKYYSVCLSVSTVNYKWLILPKKPLLSLQGRRERGFFKPYRQLLLPFEFLLHPIIFLWVCYAGSLTELSNDYL